MADLHSTDARRAFITNLIAIHGGAYILPEQNKQPDPMLRIASIHCKDFIGLGQTEAEAQADWLRQAYAGLPRPILAMEGVA